MWRSNRSMSCGDCGGDMKGVYTTARVGEHTADESYDLP
jgi:hypothetical protein